MKSHLAACEPYLNKERKKKPNAEPEDAQPNNKKQKIQPILDVNGGLCVLSPDKKKILDELLANAIHKKGQEFTVLDGEDYDIFFAALSPAYKRPTAEIIGGQLLSM